MALTVKGNEKVNGAAVNHLEEAKLYIGRRTGAVIKINARKDSDGFDRIEDYFPDSESEDEENKSSTDVKPIKLKPNQFIGRPLFGKKDGSQQNHSIHANYTCNALQKYSDLFQNDFMCVDKNDIITGGGRTGALIEINARKDSHGFHLIEDYFPDSVTESDISMASNKANKTSSMNKSITSKVEKMFESKEENQEEQAIENQDGEDQLIEPADKSHVASVSKEKKDVTPQEKDVEISPNLSGTAVKNSVTSCEPTPQFFGSKKRLFPSTEILDITRENKDESEQDIDIVGVSDEEEEEEKGARLPLCNPAQTKNKAPATTQKEIETAKDDTFIVDGDGDESPCVFLENNSKRSNVKDAGNAQKEKVVCHVESKDDTLIVDIDDESTFVTLGNKSKDSKVKNLSYSDLVPEEEVSYQMDESVILEGTKHKVMSPEFGGVSNHTLRSSGVQDDVEEEEEVAKPKGRMARKSNQQTTKKGVKEQEGAEDKDDHQGVITFKQKSRKSTKPVQNKSDEEEVDENQESVADVSVNVTDVDPVKKPTRKSKKPVPNKNSKEEKVEDEKEENGVDVSVTLSRLNQTTEDDKAVNSLKNGSKRPFKKSVPNKSSKEEQEDDGADISVRLGQTTEDDKAVKKDSRKTKKSISKKSLKEKEDEEEKQEQEIKGQTKARQNTGDDKSDKKNAKRKSTRKTQTEQDGSSADASEEDLEHLVQGEAKASNKTEDDKSDKKNSKRKSTRKTRKEQDGDASEGEKEQPEEKVMTRRATRSNTSKLASTTFNSLTNLTLNKTKTKKTKAPNTRSTRSKNKSIALEKEDGGSRESENEKNNKAGSHETLEEEDDENQIMATEREEDMPQEMGMNDTAVHDTALTKDGGCNDILGEHTRNRRSTSKKGQENKSTSEIDEPEVVDNGDDDIDGDDEQESHEISKKSRKNGQKWNGKKSNTKRHRLTASTNQSASDSSHNDDDDDDDKDEDGMEDDSNGNTRNDSRNISNNAKNKYKGKKKSINSNSVSDDSKDRVNRRGRKIKHRSKGRLTLPRLMAKKPSASADKTTENDVTDQEGTADEDDTTTKTKKKQPEDVALENDETVNKSINKSSRKRTNGTRVDSLRVPESSTPASNNDTPNVLPPSSVKSILKSSITRTQSDDAKKRRVSIAANRKGSDAANDDGNSGNPNRRRKSSVSFAPTPSFRNSPDDFSTPEESPGKLAKLSFVTNYSGFTSEDNTFTPGDVLSASLASSVSSAASNSSCGSDSSCVNDSQEITINSAKRRQIADNEGKDDSGVRRSKRTKVPALQYWKNERIKYERRQSGWFVSGIEKVPTPKVVKRKSSKKPKKEKKRGTTRNEYQEEDSKDFINKENGTVIIPRDADMDVPADMEDMEEVTYTGIPVVNPDNGEQVKLDLVHTPEMLNFVNTSRKPAQTDDALIMDKYMSHNLFGAGQIVLRPGAEKGKQHVRDDTMIFYVVKGRLEVTIHESTVFLRTGSTFFVPTGNWYNIKNADCKDARLLFVQIKG